MSRTIHPTLRLECAVCDWRPANEVVLEAVKLHFEVEHNSCEVNLNLVAVCTCDVTMRATATTSTGRGLVDHFLCPSCGNDGSIKRKNSDRWRP